MPVFLGFLDEAEQQTARRVLRAYDAQCYAFFGGFDEAERRILGCFPDYMQPDDACYPLTALAFTYRTEKLLTHRDFLGTLLSIGVKRETIGDILCGTGLTVLFLREEIVPFVCEQVTKIGGEGVSIRTEYNGPLPAAHTFQSLQDTIASPRLDVIVKTLTRTSREQASQMILGGFVSLNHVVVEDASARIEAPSVVSVRGIGRFMIDQIGPPTKKGRLYLSARRCI